MSAVNPAAAAAAAASAAEAALALELQQLAADAAALRTMLMQGDVVQATVQPFNGATDVLEIFGLKVAASLPPNVYPGDTLTVAVQGFQGDQVMVQVLSSQTGATVRNAPQQPPNTAAQMPPAPVQPADTVELTRTPIPVVVDEPVAPAAQLSPQAQPQAAQNESAADTPATISTPPSPAQVFATQVRPPPTQPETLSVEARLALARTSSNLVPPPPQASTVVRGAVQNPGPQSSSPQSSSPQAAPSQAQPPQAAAPQAARPAPSAPPPSAANIPRIPIIPIVPRGPSSSAATSAAPLPGAPAQLRATTMTPPSLTQVGAANADELLQDPVQLLRALRIPVTPTALTFAKLVTTQPQQVATALRALETALPDSNDPRITTLRTLAAFVGTLEPESPTFTTQVASFLSHVSVGPEAKLFSLVQPQQTAAQNPAPGAPAATATAATAAQASDETALAAHTVERLAAADADLKTQLVALLSSPQTETALGDTGSVVARNALTALVVSQLGTLASQQAQPPSWTFTVPITIDQQVYPAQVKVSRDKPEGKGEPLTADDFHIAFILDTKRFGTVAIDVHAVQRSVSVAVRTERPSAATTFKSALAQLGGRLQTMKYNVKSLEAATTKTKTETANAPPPSDELHAMDSTA